MRFQAPQLPPLDEVAPFFAESQATRWFSNNGPCVRRLERECSDYLGLDRPGVAVANATAGLMVALRGCFGMPSGTRRLVAVPSFTFVATLSAITWAGFEPLFVDIDPDDWHPAQADLHELTAVRDELAGVMLCSTFGTPPSPQRRKDLADAMAALDVPVVVDSAAGFGAVDVDGRHLGDQGHAEVFSFHATKPFAIGEGGLITSTDPDLLDRMRRLNNFGFDAHHDVPELVGINGKLQELTAAVGLAVLRRFDDILAARRAAAGWLLAELGGHGVAGQHGNAGSAFQFVPVVLPDPAARDRVLASAGDAGIEVRTYFDPPMHRLAPFAQTRRIGSLEHTDRLAQRIVALPMANDITSGQLERVRDLVLSAL